MNAGTILRGGIIAAGHGERLRAGGWTGSKAMLPVAGLPLIDHALDRFAANGLEHVSVIINETSVDCRNHLASRRPPPSIHLIVRSTPSSFASFALLAGWLAGARAVITTVDALMPAAEFARFIAAATQLPPDAIGLGLTSHVDDEAPLWAEVDPADGRIRRLGGAPARMSPPGCTRSRRTCRCSRKPDSTGCAIISGNSWTTGTRSTASTSTRCSTSTVRTTAFRPNARSRPGPRAAGSYDVEAPMLGDLPRTAAFARPGR